MCYSNCNINKLCADNTFISDTYLNLHTFHLFLEGLMGEGLVASIRDELTEYYRSVALLQSQVCIIFVYISLCQICFNHIQAPKLGLMNNTKQLGPTYCFLWFSEHEIASHGKDNVL